jgi:hypothetical protein
VEPISGNALSLVLKHWTRLYLTVSVKHSSLPQFGFNYGLKKFNSAGPFPDDFYNFLLNHPTFKISIKSNLGHLINSHFLLSKSQIIFLIYSETRQLIIDAPSPVKVLFLITSLQSHLIHHIL